MVRTRTFYRAALLCPLLLPIILFGVVGLEEGLGRASEVLTNAFMSLGAAYLALLIGLFGWSRGRSGRDLQRAARLSPLFYTVILATQYGLGLFTARTPFLAEAGLVVAIVGTVLIGMVFGHVFVGIAEAVYQALDELGILDRSEDATGA